MDDAKKTLMTRFTANKLIFFVAHIVLLTSYYFVFNLELNWLTIAIFLPLTFIAIHYHFNIVHMASHSALSKKRGINAFFGTWAAVLSGTTYADFKANHMLHHSKAGQPDLDPDDKIARNANFLLIPFKIFYHDYDFWSKGMWKKDKAWVGYLLARSLQLCLILIASTTGHLSTWLLFWVLPVYLLGVTNGAYLFFYPHYTSKNEHKWRNSKAKNWYQKLALKLIDISRHYHEIHHEKVSTNYVYFPLEAYLFEKFKSGQEPNLDFSGKFTDIKKIKV
ncbi:MAG: fatty acid desaturase [bacterium]